MEHPVFADVFTLPEAAKRIGKSQLTLRRWVSGEMIPPPILIDTSRGYKHYSMAELNIIVGILEEHSREFDYLHPSHEVTINRIWQAIEAHRKSKI